MDSTLTILGEALERLDRKGFEWSAEVLEVYSWRVVVSRSGFSLIVFGASNEGMITAHTWPSSVVGTLARIHLRAACEPRFLDFAAERGDPIARSLKRTLKRRHDPIEPVYLRLVIGEFVDLVVHHFDAYVAVLAAQTTTPSPGP